MRDRHGRQAAEGVVHCWPAAGMYWRLSAQMRQTGGASEGGYWVPQVTQMKASMASIGAGQAV